LLPLPLALLPLALLPLLPPLAQIATLLPLLRQR